MREIPVSNARVSELRDALDAQGLTTVEVSEPDVDGIITVSVPDDADGVLVDETLRQVERDRMDSAISYRAYVALLSQSGTDAPVATVMKNTLGGEVVWTRNAVGVCVGALAGAFPSGRTAIAAVNWDLENLQAFIVHRNDNNEIIIASYDVSAFPAVAAVDGFTDILVEVRVYDAP